MTVKALKKNNMPRINGSGFKMKRTPVKGKLSDFFSSLGKQLKRNRRDIGGEFKGVKQKDKARILENRADAAYYGSAEDKAKNSEANRIKPEEPESTAYVPQEFKGKAGDKFRYRKTGESVKGENTLNDFEFMKPGSNTWTKAGENKGGGYAGFNNIQDLFYNARREGTTFDSPIDKKSTAFKMPGYGKRK